jgi:hypothetical protein
VLVVVPRLVAGLLNDADEPPIGQIWEDTRLSIPSDNFSGTYRNVFTGQELDPHTSDRSSSFAVSKILADFPVGLYFAQAT